MRLLQMLRWALDMGNAAMEAVRETCEGDRLDGDSVQFCQSTLVAAASERFPTVCTE